MSEQTSPTPPHSDPPQVTATEPPSHLQGTPVGSSQPRRRSGRWLEAVALVLALAAVLTGYLRSSDEPSTPTVAGDGGEPAAGAPGADTATGGEDAAGTTSDATAHPTMGDPDAPVTMVEYSDFLCPYCGRFAADTKPELIREYVDKGLLRIEWRDYPAKGDAAIVAAVAARAAHQQGRFWEYHDLLFANQGAVDRDTLLAHAQQLGLDMAAFEKALDNPFLREAVMADYREGQERGVRGTPTFYFNGQVLVGAQPTQTFHDAMQFLLEDGAGTGA